MGGDSSPDLKRGYLPFETPRRWKRGDPLTADHLNEASDAVAAIQQQIQAPRVVETSIVPEALEVQRFVVVTEYGDYFSARKQGGSTSSDVSTEPTVFIAKPYLCRRTPFDGETRNGISYAYSSDTERVATDTDSDTETQQIVPSYVAGDVIFAAQNFKGGTGVWTAPTNSDPVEVLWLDLNLDGRAWAKV